MAGDVRNPWFSPPEMGKMNQSESNFHVNHATRCKYQEIHEGFFAASWAPKQYVRSGGWWCTCRILDGFYIELVMGTQLCLEVKLTPGCQFD